MASASPPPLALPLRQEFFCGFTYAHQEVLKISSQRTFTLCINVHKLLTMECFSYLLDWSKIDILTFGKRPWLSTNFWKIRWGGLPKFKEPGKEYILDIYQPSSSQEDPVAIKMLANSSYLETNRYWYTQFWDIPDWGDVVCTHHWWCVVLQINSSRSMPLN